MENELSCSNYWSMMEMSTEQLTNCYFQTNWDNSNDQNDPFESAYSSMVSSLTTTPTSSSNGGDGIMIRELIGRLGSICDSSSEILPHTRNNSSTNTSCYNTPLNSLPPSKFNLSSLMINSNHNLNYPTNLGSISTDPGFVKSSPKFSCFSNATSNNINVNSNINHSFSGNNIGGISIPINPENNGDSREGSSITGQNPSVELSCKPQNCANSRKRKPIPKTKLKDITPSTDKVDLENEESDAKRSKVENEENKGECNSSKEKKNNNNNDNNDTQKPEPPKDYIHVRARRGQAIDGHSLAERARRERISERMKFLQDLVPGCNKVTGKATVLDEIINYVQSLQRQVEFLSMKLSTVNPRMEFNMEALLSKDMFQTKYPLEQKSAQAFPFDYQSAQQIPLPLLNGGPIGIENSSSVNPRNAVGNKRNSSVPLPFIDGFANSMSQLPTLWEDDLQSIVQMGIVQDQTQGVPGTLPIAQ